MALISDIAKIGKLKGSAGLNNGTKLAINKHIGNTSKRSASSPNIGSNSTKKKNAGNYSVNKNNIRIDNGMKNWDPDSVDRAQSYAKEVLAKSPKAQPDKEAQAALKKRLQEKVGGGKSRFANPKRASQEEIAQYADSVADRQYKGYMKRAKELGLTDKSTSYKATGPAFKPKEIQTPSSTRSTRLPGDKQIDKLVKQTTNRYMNNVLHAGDPLNKVKPKTPVTVEQYKKPNKPIKTNKTKEIITSNLDDLDAKGINGGAQGAWISAKGLGFGAKNHYLDPIKGAERRKDAYRGTFQAAAVSAGAHAGVAMLNGDDPWEAAKTGAFRGALAGGGYQTLKGATGANTGSVWGNMKHIGTTSKDLYRATTIKGREEFRQKGMSDSLSTLLSAKSGMAESTWFRSKKGNTTTQKVMGSQ